LDRCADGQIQSVPCLSCGKGDGMPTLLCSGGLQPPGCKTADGRLWFPTSKGLVVVEPDDAKANPLPPPVVIEKALVDGALMTPNGRSGSPMSILPGRQRYEFRYTALSFVAPEKVRFQCRLEPLDPEWMDTGTRRTANYTYLPPGNYTFRVIACNSDGVWNTAGAALAFTVQPHFWQVWWFRVLAGLAASALLTGVVLFDARRRMRRKLERVERQRAIERERARIAQDIHDNLGANLTRISLLSQSAHSELDNPRNAATQLDRIYSTARELTRAMDEIVWAVNPQHDTLDSLASYLGNFAQDFLGSLNIRCRLNVPLQLPHWPLTAEVRHNLFLAVKEALHNVVKHAAASEVYITVTTDPDSFTLIVRDNGTGFVLDAPAPARLREPGRPARGNGLANMRQRLAKLGGHCEIQTAPGNGTEVKFVVPVAAHRSRERG
jgi:signal transduction histidine kinase